MNEAPTGNAADRRILIKSSPVRCWREEPILIPSYVPAASVSRSVLRPQPLCRYRRRHRSCRGPYRARSRSDKHAAVLRLQRTQPKDRRVYTAFTGILAEQPAAKKDRALKAGAAQAEPKSRRQRNAGILSFIHLYSNRDREGFPLLIWKGACIIWKKQKLCVEVFLWGYCLS